jgi:ribonuclease T2
LKRLLRLGALAASFALAPIAFAQDARPFRSDPPGAFDSYILALTWSPTFCALEGGGRDREQCEPGRRLGFVVHGLWPQLDRGRLADCETVARSPSRAALNEAEGVFPSLGLARHQWRKHGSCTGQSPAGYFRDVRRAREQVRIPEVFAEAVVDRRTSPREIERAFVAANPGLRADMIAVTCRRDRLQEVRICFERDLRGYRSCGRADRSGCPIDEITVTGAR